MDLCSEGHGVSLLRHVEFCTAAAHHGYLVRQNFAHTLRMKREEFRVKDEITRMFELKRAL